MTADPVRLEQIVRLLETRDDHLPMPSRREHSASGFVNKPSPRSCPDCLANGRPMVGCETCGGSGVVSPARLGAIAAPDVRDDDGQERDAYAESKVQPYGIEPAGHDRMVALDNAIAAAGRALAGELRPVSAEDELDRANREPFPWEVERARHGDIYTLPNGRHVQIERVDHYDDQPSGEIHVIRWRAGTSIGSLKPMRPGCLINVQRTPRLRRPVPPRPPPL